MRRFIKIDPPSPDDSKYRGNPLGWQRDMFEWAKGVVGKLEQSSAQNDTPLDQMFVVTSFTTNTSLTGTSTLGDVANFLCTLVQAFTNKRIIKSKE